MSTDRNLLFGVLALPMDFIDRHALVATMQAWVFDKRKPVGEILRDLGRLSPARQRLLEDLVEEHLQAHQGDGQQSLAAVPAASSVQEQLRDLRDPDLEASLVSLAAGRRTSDAEATVDSQSVPGLRYHILRPHAKGGLGEVFVALDAELNREVALKEMQKQHADVAHSRSRFVLEAEVSGGLARFSHQS